MEKNVEMSLLLSFYGNILTEKQKDAANLYYNEDLSLAEISEIIGITRQGVRDNVKRAETVLYDIEDKLGLCKKFLMFEKEFKYINSSINKISDSLDVSDIPSEIKICIRYILDSVSRVNENLQKGID